MSGNGIFGLAAAGAFLALGAVSAQAQGYGAAPGELSFGGAYVGVFAGRSDARASGDYEDDSSNSGSFGPISFDATSFGVRAGFDQLVNDFLLIGVVADFATSNARVVEGVQIGVSGDASSSINNESSLRLRAGFTSGPLLVYGTVGYGRASLSHNISAGPIDASADQSVSGITYGLGVEYLVSQNVSIELLYRVANYGTTSYVLTDSNGHIHPYTVDGDLDLRTETISFGVNYRF